MQAKYSSGKMLLVSRHFLLFVRSFNALMLLSEMHEGHSACEYLDSKAFVVVVVHL